MRALALQVQLEEHVILFSHGNAQDLHDALPFELAHGTGATVYAYEYPGYSAATGRPSEHGCFAAGRAAWEFVTKEHSPTLIVVMGFSLGTGPGRGRLYRMHQVSHACFLS